jgi:hypothetical protein
MTSFNQYIINALMDARDALERAEREFTERAHQDENPEDLRRADVIEKLSKTIGDIIADESDYDPEL